MVKDCRRTPENPFLMILCVVLDSFCECLGNLNAEVEITVMIFEIILSSSHRLVAKRESFLSDCLFLASILVYKIGGQYIKRDITKFSNYIRAVGSELGYKKFFKQ